MSFPFQVWWHQTKRIAVRATVTGVVVLGTVEMTTHLLSQGRSSRCYHFMVDEWVTPTMRRLLDPEGAFV
jgi:hypothetical protein